MNPTAAALPPPMQALAVLAHGHRLQGQAPRAALLYEALAALHPAAAPVLLGLAASQLAAGRPAQALQALEQLALAGHAPDQAFHLLRAQALLAAGRRDEAQAAMQAALARRREASA